MSCPDNRMTRGLAMRSFCSLRVKNVVEHLVRPLLSELKDYHGYVRMAVAIEAFDVKNLSDRFQHASSAVVLATQKVFLPMPMSTADVHQQVLVCPSFFVLMSHHVQRTGNVT